MAARMGIAVQVFTSGGQVKLRECLDSLITTAVLNTLEDSPPPLS